MLHKQRRFHHHFLVRTLHTYLCSIRITMHIIFRNIGNVQHGFCCHDAVTFENCFVAFVPSSPSRAGLSSSSKCIDSRKYIDALSVLLYHRVSRYDPPLSMAPSITTMSATMSSLSIEADVVCWVTIVWVIKAFHNMAKSINISNVSEDQH